MNCTRNCIRQQVTVIRMAELLTVFILTIGATLPLQAQTDSVSKPEPEVASASWEQYGYGAAHVGYNPLEKTLSIANVSQLTQTWSFPTNAAIYVPTLTSGKTVFVDSTDGNLYALNASTGALLWQFSGTITGDAYGGGAQGMAISGSTLYVNCQIDNVDGGHAGICALGLTGKKAGKVLWTWAIYTDAGQAVGSAPAGSPVVSGGVLVVGEDDTVGSGGHSGYLVGLDTKTGALLWQIGNCSDGGGNDCGGPSVDAAAVSKGVVYYGTNGLNGFAGLCAVELSSGASLWCYNTGDGGSPAAVSGNTVYVNTADGTIFALNAKTGALIWTSACGDGCGRSYNPPAVAKGVVYVAGTYYGYIEALSAKTGKVLWQGLPGYTFASSPSIANGVLYVQCGYICALDASTGALLWTSSYAGSSSGSSSPAVVNGTVYDEMRIQRRLCLQRASGGKQEIGDVREFRVCAVTTHCKNRG